MITEAMRRACDGAPPRPGTWHPAYDTQETRAALLHWMRNGPSEHLFITAEGLFAVLSCEESADRPEPCGAERELVRLIAAGPSGREGYHEVWWCAVDSLGRQLAEPEAHEVPDVIDEDTELPEALVTGLLERLIGGTW